MSRHSSSTLARQWQQEIAGMKQAKKYASPRSSPMRKAEFRRHSRPNPYSNLYHDILEQALNRELLSMQRVRSSPSKRASAKSVRKSVHSSRKRGLLSQILSAKERLRPVQSKQTRKQSPTGSLVRRLRSRRRAIAGSSK